MNTQVAKLLGALALAAALMGIGFAGAWAWQDNKFTGQLEKQALTFQKDLAAINAAGAAQTRAAVEHQQAAQLALANLDQQSSQEKANALAENEKLRAAVAAGARRLRIAGSCTAGNSPSAVPASPSTARVDDGGTIELSAATGSAVFDIRAGITSDQEALIALQRYVREQCLK